MEITILNILKIDLSLSTIYFKKLYTCFMCLDSVHYKTQVMRYFKI